MYGEFLDQMTTDELLIPAVKPSNGDYVWWISTDWSDLFQGTGYIFLWRGWKNSRI